MIKELLKSLDYSVFGEIALVIFLCAFVLVVVHVLVADRRRYQAYGELVFTDTSERKETGHES